MPAPHTISNSELYGAPRPKTKTNAINLSSTSIHALATELSSLRNEHSKGSKSAPARPRTTSSKTNDLFQRKNKGVGARAAKDAVSSGKGSVTTSKDLGGNLTGEEMARSRRMMARKTEMYKKLKRGEVHDGEKGAGVSLVDFDRKWAERQQKGDDNASSDDEEQDVQEDDGMRVEYEDEFGRTRTGTRKEAQEASRAKEAAAEAAETAETAKIVADNEGRPLAPAHVIYGNTIQTHAFQTPKFATAPRPAELVAALPDDDPEAHYDASGEVRTKGVGFYAFSQDNAERKRQMEELDEVRLKTERERIVQEREERRKRKREEIEKRKEEVRSKRRGKVGERWLEGFMAEYEGGAGAGKCETKDEEKTEN